MRIRAFLISALAAVVAVAGLHAPPATAAPAPAAEDQLPSIPVPPLVTEEWNGSTGVNASNERWVKSISDLAKLTEEPEVRDAALKILATGDAAAIRQWALTQMPVISKQVSDRKAKEATERLAKVKSLLGTGIPNGYFNAEAQRVYKGSDWDRVLFLAYGADIARARDQAKIDDGRERAAQLRERLRVFAAAAAQGSQVRAAAELALSGDDAAVEAYFKSGYAVAAQADAAARERYLADLEERNRAAEQLSDLAKRAERANQARVQIMVAHGAGVRALQRSANAMAGAANAARHSQRVLAGSGTTASKAGDLNLAKQQIANDLEDAQQAVQDAQAASASARTAVQVLEETGLTYGVEWAAMAVGMSEAATAAAGAITTAGHAVDATIATNAAQDAEAKAKAHAQLALDWKNHAAEHALAAAKLAAAAKKQADAAKTAAARTKTAKEQAQAAEAKAWAEAEKVRQQKLIAQAQAAEAERQRKIAETERAEAERKRAEAEEQANIARKARAEADAQSAIADQARSRAQDAEDGASAADERAWEQERIARQARDDAMAAEREEQTAKARAQAMRAAAASAATDEEKREAQEQADEADRQAGIAGSAARSARSQANIATGAAANARAAATQAQDAADRAWAAAEKSRAAAAAADSAADKAEAGARATHAARVRADAKAAEATAQQTKAAEAANAAQRLSGQAAEQAVRALWAADRTKAEAEGARNEAVAASEQAESAVRSAAAAAQSSAGIAAPANTAIGMVSPFTGTDIDADFVAQVAAQAEVIGTEQAESAQARAAEALEAARAADTAAQNADSQVRPAYLSAAAAARSAAEAAESAAQARTSAAQAAADGAAARAAAASAGRADAQARADAAAARQAANEAANDAAIAGRTAQEAQNAANQASQAASAAEADAAAARGAADRAEADAAMARTAADNAQRHADSAATAATNALQHAVDAQKAADRAEEAERERAAQELADAAADLPPDATEQELWEYLTPEEAEQLRQAEAEAGLSILDFIKAEAEDLFWELSGVGDLVSCIRDGNVVACLWSLAGLLGGIKAVRAGYKIAKLVPKLIKFLDRVKDAKKRRDALRELARKKKKKKDREDSCTLSARKNSFLPGTPVLLPGGATKAIEDLRVGDLVMATDPATGLTIAKPVTATIDGDGEKKLVDVTIDTDGDRGDATATVTATHNHPFWVPALAQWVDAERLAAKQKLRTSTGDLAEITAVRHRKESTEVHNLTVADIHTYYVMAAGTPVLVHNDDEEPCECAKPRDKRYKYSPITNKRVVGATGTICPDDLKPANAAREDISRVPVVDFPDPNPKDADGNPTWNKTHIIGDKFNGHPVTENLFKGYAKMNTSGMKRCEYIMIKALKRKEVVTYTGTLTYRSPTDLEPSGIQMTASSDKSGKLFDQWVENKNVRSTECK
ncbi:polymorphic toxin-type HINT domain-containing protein [Actinoplanes sp. NPDC023714]|uniref:polymorphic toxin-type HINT domain-containing protein n=1 Tax=Actinoplanes sp. NPDC023714 TaxID=3154322 RepID=UPI0033EAD02E